MITSEVACPECGTLWLRSVSSDGAHQPKPYCSEKCEDKAENPAAGTCPKCGRTICVGCDHFTPAQTADKGAEKTCQCSYGDRLWNSFNQCLNCMRSIYVPSMTTPAQTADIHERWLENLGQETADSGENCGVFDSNGSVILHRDKFSTDEVTKMLERRATPPEPDGLVEQAKAEIRNDLSERWALSEKAAEHFAEHGSELKFAMISRGLGRDVIVAVHSLLSTFAAQAIAADRLKRAEVGCEKCKTLRICHECGHKEGEQKGQLGTHPKIRISTWSGDIHEPAPCNPIYAHEIIQIAIDHQKRLPPFPILAEELPNGTARIIRRNEQITLREHMNFTIIEGQDNA